MTEGELRTAMGNSSRQSTPSKSDVLDSKEQKVLDVFKERKEQKVKELKEELEEKELKEKWLKEEELKEKEPKEKELKDREQMMKEKLGERLKPQNQYSDRSSLSARFAEAKKKMQIDDNGEKATEKKSLQTHQDWLNDREKKWLLEKEENAATLKRSELREYQVHSPSFAMEYMRSGRMSKLVSLHGWVTNPQNLRFRWPSYNRVKKLFVLDRFF
jgi:hypothetical protein